ncbi:hypothetical protein A6R68_16678, partial [Neotoma lepida]
MEMRISDYFHNSISDKILHPHSLQWWVPFIHIDEINRMIICLLNIIFGRPLRVYCYHSLMERITQRKTSKSYQNNNGNYPSVRPRFYIPHFQTQNTVHRKDFKNNLRTCHKLRL